MKGVAEGHQLRQSGLAQFGNRAEEARDEFLALPARFVLLQEQVAEPLFEAVNDVQGGMLGLGRR
jgi:hypothetical protein